MAMRTPPAGPDRRAALAQYRRRAAIYDLELALFEPIRRRAIARLALQRGQTVLDLGCGTGLSLDLLRQGVGPQGRVVGIEQSPEMLAKARVRVREQHWRNVTLLGSPVETADIGVQADAALFHFTHDILCTPTALARVIAHLRPGARIVAAGLQWSQRWAVPTNLFVWSAARHSVSSLQGLDAPWRGLVRHTGDLDVDSTLLGAVFIAAGQMPGRR